MAVQEEPGKPKKASKCSSGYESSVKEAKDVDCLACASCGRICREPHLTVCCAKQYCGNYLREVAADTSNSSNSSSSGCPHCGKREFSFIPNENIQKLIITRPVLCSANECGCTWEGVVGDFDAHRDTCEHVRIPCPQECATEGIKRALLNQHLESECPRREYSCPHCSYKGEYRLVTSAHFAECSHFPVKCVNGCGLEGKRGEVEADMESHLRNECPLEHVKCRLVGVGCNGAFRRRDEARHAEECLQEHIRLLADAVEKARLKEEVLRGEFDDFVVERLGQSERQEREIAELKEQLALERSRVDFLEKQAEMAVNNSDISPPENLSGSERKEMERRISEKDDELERIQRKMEELEVSSEKRHTELKQRVDELEKCLKAQPTWGEEHAQQNGSFKFTLKNYAELKRNETEWSSPSFPVYENGPRLKVLVWANGQKEGRGTHVSAWLALASKLLERDILDLEVRLKLELMGKGPRSVPNVVTQDFLVPKGEYEYYYLGVFTDTLASHSDLLACQYLDRDSLEFRVTVLRVCTPDWRSLYMNQQQ